MESVSTRKPPLLRRSAHVVYLVASALTERDVERFGMKVLRDLGCRITVLEVANLCHPTIAQDRIHYDTLGEFRPTVVDSRATLERKAPLLAGVDLIFCLVTSGWLNRSLVPILRAVSRSGRPYGLICSNGIPGMRNYKGDLKSLHKRGKDIIARRKTIDPVSSIVSRLPRRLLGIRPADFVVFGGSDSLRDQQLFGPNTSRIMAHAYDYDWFNSAKSADSAQANTAVFLDQYLPHHRDWALLGVDTVVDTDTYYQQLRHLFGRIETELKLEVVIAAHPRSSYADKPGVFGNRRIVYNQTSKLTRECRLVLNFTSLAMNYAVCSRKPVILLTTERHYGSPAGHRYTDPMAKELGLPVLFLEKVAQADLSSMLNVNDELYDRYIRTYVKTPGSPERPYWDIVVDALQHDGLLPAKA